MRRTLGLFAVFVAIAACGSFGADDATPSVDAGAQPPTGTSSSSSSSGTTDGGVGRDAGDAGGRPIGAGCANRQPAPQACFDYEALGANTSLPSVNKNNASSLKVMSGSGSSSANALVANAVIDGDGAWAYTLVQHGGAAKRRVAWTFDLKASGFSQDTEIFEFHQPKDESKSECMLQPHFHGARIHVNEACEDGQSEKELVSIPQPADGSWVNVFIDADFELHTISLTVTRSPTSFETKTGTFSKTRLTADSELKVGVTWTADENGPATMVSDNFAAYWE